jgi:F-type H+-transporting ATPase subunit delta
MAESHSTPDLADHDTGAAHVGAVFARALLGAALKSGEENAVGEALDSLVDDVLAPHPSFEAVLSSARVSLERRMDLVDRVFGERASPLFVDFLKVLVRRERFDCVRAIRRAYRKELADRQGRVAVRLTTAVPIDDGLAARVTEGLASMLGATPELSQTVNPSLIGGAVVRVGDTVFDGSILWQLNRLREQIIDRSVHEIQSRRDRFSTSAGN